MRGCKSDVIQRAAFRVISQLASANAFRGFTSFALHHRAFERFNKMNGVTDIAVDLHDHFDVGVLDAVLSDEIRHVKADAASTLFLFVLFPHRATSPSRRMPAMIC